MGIVSRSAASVPVWVSVSDNGPSTGESWTVSVRDVGRALWLNHTDGTWQASRDGDAIKALTEVPDRGLYEGAITRTGGIGGDSLTGEVLLVYYEEAGGAILTEVLELSALTAQQVWEYLIAQSSGVGGSAAELLNGAGGGSSPGAVAAAVWSALPEDYQTALGSFGKAIYDLDPTALGLLLEAAVSKITRIGHAYNRLFVYEQFAGESQPVSAPVVDDGNLADLTGATVSWAFTNTATGTRVVIAGELSATPGHVQYVTQPGDAIVDAAGTWRGQATTTLADTSVIRSEIVVLKVKAVV